MGEFEDKVRSAFDSELNRAPARPGVRQRVIANAVATPRHRQSWFRVWLSPPRMALAGAAVAILVIAGVGYRLATQSAPVTAHRAPTPTSAALAFGALPPPGLHPPQGLGAGGGGAPTTEPYFGPATLTWAGQLPKVPASAPVYRFTLPTAPDFDAFAVRLGATPEGSGGVPGSRTYRGPDGYTMFIGPDPIAYEPVFILNRDTGPSGSQPLGEAKARTAADAELSRLGLTPSWKFAVHVTVASLVAGPQYAIDYQRLVQVNSSLTAGEVDGNGDPSGIQVTVDSGGTVMRVSGVLRLAEQAATYPLRSATAALDLALKASATPNPSAAVPAVALTKLTLVYTAVRAGADDYLEPAYLFTGSFTINGYPYEMRLLVPALVGSGLRS